MKLSLSFRLDALCVPEVETFLIKIEPLEPSELRIPIQQFTTGFILFALKRFNIFGERVRSQFVLRNRAELSVVVL